MINSANGNVSISNALRVTADNAESRCINFSILRTYQYEYERVFPGREFTELGGDGHRIALYNNLSAKDPTYQELKDFLWNDKTDTIPYKSGSFVCADYAETVHNNAEQAGIRAAWVVIECENGISHAFNTFNTWIRD